MERGGSFGRAEEHPPVGNHHAAPVDDGCPVRGERVRVAGDFDRAGRRAGDEPKHPQDGLEHLAVVVLVLVPLRGLRFEKHNHVPFDRHRREAERRLADPCHGAPGTPPSGGAGKAAMPNGHGKAGHAVGQREHVVSRVTVAVQILSLDRLLLHERKFFGGVDQPVERDKIEGRYPHLTLSTRTVSVFRARHPRTATAGARPKGEDDRPHARHEPCAQVE